MADENETPEDDMKKTIAIPQALIEAKNQLLAELDTAAEDRKAAIQAEIEAIDQEIADKYGDQPMTEQEIAERIAEQEEAAGENPGV